jgi:PAS domain S-box-containing protein
MTPLFATSKGVWSTLFRTLGQIGTEFARSKRDRNRSMRWSAKQLLPRGVVSQKIEAPTKVTALTDIREPSPGLRGDEPAAATDQAISDRKELAFIAVERTRMPMVVTDPRRSDNPIILANKAFLDLCGYPADQVLGRNCRFMQGPETDRRTIADMHAALARGEEVNAEVLNYRRDGTAMWLQLMLSPVHDEDGQLIYYFGSQLDVTERRSVEATERRLLKEVDHRARNVLAIVEGIVRLTRSEDTPGYMAAVQSRVRALAAAHSLLSERGWSDIPLDKLIEGQISPFDASRVTLTGHALLLRPSIVQPLALVIHELISNSAAHGCLRHTDGSLEIAWAAEPDRNLLELDWRERGGPAPAHDRRQGFGETIIRNVVERQLRGRLRRSWEPSGFTAHLSVPLGG